MVAWRMTSADRFCPAMCKILVVPQDHGAGGAVAIDGLGIDLDALDGGVVVAADFAFRQVFVRYAFRLLGKLATARARFGCGCPATL